MLTMQKAGIECFDLIFPLMDQAFPQTEHRTKSDQKELFKNPRYSYRIFRGEKGEFLGFLAVWDFSDFRYAEHFAINESLRGHGIGAKALRMWVEEEKTPVVLEVEPPETQIAQRRIGFYQRLGFTLNDFPYMQPPMQKGLPLIPLIIMSWPGSITAEEFQPWKERIYRDVYKITNTQI